MAKRGRPPKPKIETVKNPVGKPRGHKNLSVETRNHYILAIWIKFHHVKINESHKKRMIAAYFSVSVDTVKKLLQQFEKGRESGEIIVLISDDEPMIITTAERMNDAYSLYQQGINPLNAFKKIPDFAVPKIPADYFNNIFPDTFDK